MYIVDGVAYSGEQAQLLKVVGIKPMSDLRLWLRLSNQEERIYDVRPMLEYPVFSKLANPEVFNEVYLDYGVPTWLDGEIDIAPESLYQDSVAYIY
ncbi:hypothetical protein FACS1894104_5290 [Actinomycetota bacterium]|nr:hypothetical protein FACS1894104_5290 [Actinomycetota bacterium]